MSRRNILPLSGRFIGTFLFNAAAIRFGRPDSVRPLILTYFVTFRCNLACSYCDYAYDGYAGRHPEVDTASVLRILSIAREGVPSVAFTGGEPLLRSDIVSIVRHARKIGFRPISLFTNALLLPDREEVLDEIDYLQISLDSLNASRQDELCGRTGLGGRLVSLVRRYARGQKEHGYRLNINSVVTERNIDDLADLARFAADEGIRLTISPRLESDGRPDPALVRDSVAERYRAAIDGLISAKRDTNAIMDIHPFLGHVRDLHRGPCFPWLTPRVYPDGRMHFPCSIESRCAPDIVQLGSWKRVRQVLQRVPTACSRPCMLPCYLEASLLASHPTTLFQEIK